jgi:hypothetical protein
MDTKWDQSDLLRATKTVDRLFSPKQLQLTDDDLTFYQRLPSWAQGLDRQSVHAEMKRKEATGHETRVLSIVRIAEHEEWYLPMPPRRGEERQDGELLYEFDKAPWKHVWFVDGQQKNATGFSASPHARPELWRARHVIRTLSRYDIRPRACIVGKDTRFFRAGLWFYAWFDSIQALGIALVVSGWGEVTSQTLPAMIMAVEAQSRALREAKRTSLEVRKTRGEIGHGVATFGLQFDAEDRQVVRVHPEEWALLVEMTRRTATGELRTAVEGIAWMVENAERFGVDSERVPRSKTWLLQFFRKEHLEGVYRSYTQTCIPRTLEQADLPLRDFDLTESGHYRYLRMRQEGISFDIEMGDMKLPPQVVAQARHRIFGKRGRPTREAPHAIPTHRALCVFPNGLLRCRCGSYIEERCPQGQKPPSAFWTLAVDLLHMEHYHAGVSSVDSARLCTELLQSQDATARPIDRKQILNRRHHLETIGLGGDWAQDREKLVAWWHDPFRKRPHSWHLYCHCAETVLDRDAAEVTEEAQHPRVRTGSISLAAWPLLWDAFTNNPLVLPEEPNTKPAAAGDDLRARLEEIRAEIALHNKRLGEGAFGETGSEEAEQEFQDVVSPLREERREINQHLKQVAEQAQRARGDRMSPGEIAELQSKLRAIERHPRLNADLRWKRAFASLVVRCVTIDMRSGEFVIETRVPLEALRRFVGVLDPGIEGASSPSTKEHAPQTACSFLHRHDESARVFRLRGYLNVMAA